MSHKTLGIAVVGLGGAVGTTMVAGIELLKLGLIGTEGLPLSGLDENLARYEEIVFAGWDLNGASLAEAAKEHGVLNDSQFAAVKNLLGEIRPWPAIVNRSFLTNIEGKNNANFGNHEEALQLLRGRLRDLAAECTNTVVINLASTERLAEYENEVFSSLASFEKAIARNSALISPAMLYAYAAVKEGIPYGNFTPSVAAEIPALVELAEKKSVPIAGKDGKTGQTFLKTVLAPAFKSRALNVTGWYSTNLLGNRDGLALSHEDSLESKVKTKRSVLGSILGYEVEDHIVDIRYYKPRGDSKEAWDSIDITGFLGQPMQVKVNFLCRDSILAAPLAIEIARCLDLASRRNEKGIQEQLSMFFKLPMSQDGRPEHAFHRQEDMLFAWLQGNG